MDDGGLLGRIWSFLSVQLAAWAIFCLNVVAWFKVRNERLRDINAEVIELRKENRQLRNELAECHRASLQHQGARVIAEAQLIARDKLDERPTLLPGVGE